MSYNTNLMFIQMPSPRRPTMPVSTTSSIRTLGKSRGGGMSKSGNFTSSKTDDKRKENSSRPALSLKDITKFDLMSPFAVQQLTGSFQSSFPTIAGKEASNVKMLNVQLPKNPYAALPRLALTKGEDVREEARMSLIHGLGRSHSELSHFRTRDSHRALLQDRPHTESRLTRRAQHGGPAFFSSRASTISEESRPPPESEDSSNSETTRKESERTKSHLEESPQQYDKSSTYKELVRIRRAKVRAQTKRATSGKGTKPGRATTAEKIANLAMSEYTEVHANNGQIDGQVWSGVKPRTAPDGSRLVRFNTHNDVFEYTPGQCIN
ncbi:uncharacterized protein LOC754205 [Strongylocentrotus purpuratus]|uniref:Uncharacterized protein n=1 Tax=Strongylocentrotus purpuratus TaxID=7668 RepID=A0A7M7GJT3_STRPU|nr:uncharacterized protein LOC754205 [Strongylocentrotus purpuratus]|eukprot:XP_003728272.1 PREDICTED: uncharacterized protein LOC754205 [Strongylocentrotus purpuratus]